MLTIKKRELIDRIADSTQDKRIVVKLYIVVFAVEGWHIIPWNKPEP